MVTIHSLVCAAMIPLIGVNPLSATPGSNETDVLIGGRGRDVFVLGDATKTYYQGTGVAQIQDFQTRNRSHSVKRESFQLQYSW